MKLLQAEKKKAEVNAYINPELAEQVKPTLPPPTTVLSSWKRGELIHVLNYRCARKGMLSSKRESTLKPSRSTRMQ